MNLKTPITLLVDDSSPLVHVYRYHWADVHHKEPCTTDGRPLLDSIPNQFLDRFCDVTERWGMAGKFAIVPAPAGLGDVVHGIAGFDPQLTRDWLNTAKKRLGPRFDFTPEGLTHNLAVDLASGASLPEGESVWSQTQNREILTPYLTRELELLKAAGVNATGFTSCWTFGQKVEAEYIASIVAAQKAVYDRHYSWYFLHIWDKFPSARPYLAYAREGDVLVAVNSTVDDYFWGAINSPRLDDEFADSIVDNYLSAYGKSGAIRRVLDAGGWPVIMTHWQSFFANGLETGLRALDRLGERVQNTLKDEVVWTSCLELANLTMQNLDFRGIKTSGN
jgi:hypothetical protein